MYIPTVIIEASVPTDTANRVEAFSRARNGDFADVVSELLEAGLKAKLMDAPELFEDAFKRHWMELHHSPDKEG